jgi:mono/diheme cytochrome c family protein
MVRNIAIFWLVGMAAVVGTARAEDTVSEAFFENRVRPVLAGVCLRCHGPQKQSGGLRLDSRDAIVNGGESGAAIDASNLDRSLLLLAIRRIDGVSAMPPDKALVPQQVADLTAWVRSGAPWPARTARISALSHWAFQPIREVIPPAVHDEHWAQRSIDRFILARLDAIGRKPAPPADRRTLLRRVTFDLTGLPPNYDDIKAFEQDRSPRAIESVVDRLLASPAYGERWGRHWLDVVRYADTAGETADYPVPPAWRYRNYVIDAFNADKPYDEFVREQIAGDILAEEGPRERYAERATATGYLAISRRFGFDSENYHHLTIQDTIDTMGQSVLGLSLGCARCHDHKFDPISMNDYYSLYGIFDSSRYAFPGSEQKQRVRALLPLVPPSESQVQWREFDATVAAMISKLEEQKQPVPKAVLRSLHGSDGDFELQAPAAGGSNGVLVPPWLYEGTIAVTSEAQSPYRNLYARGKVGVYVPPGAGRYRISQAIYPLRTRNNCKLLYVNLDFRVASPRAGPYGSHRFWIGAQPNLPAVEVLISADAVSLRSALTIDRIGALQANAWHNLQLILDLQHGTVAGSFGTPGQVTTFSKRRFAPEWPGRIDLIMLDDPGAGRAEKETQNALPAIELDNFGIQETPVAAVSTAASTTPRAATPADARAALARLDVLLADGPFALAYGIAEGTPHDVRMHMRGEPDQPGALVRRGLIKSLGGGPLAANARGSGRLELAEWLTRRDNPLTARVMVNRIWQYHFGRGLVNTPNDFGIRGRLPTHPELLDHLAALFIQRGWSVKAMHRLLILSATYQQSSTSNLTAPNDLDESPAADTYAAFARRRLSAEEIRDSILTISGELDRTLARGHPFPSPTGWGFTQHAPFSAVHDHTRRSVYLMTQRLKRHPFLALFDGADPSATTAVRLATTVPTQALYFMNDPFVHSKAEQYASRLQTAWPDDRQRIEQAWHDVLGRSPTDIERTEAVRFLNDYRAELAVSKVDRTGLRALAAYVRTLFGSNEFVYLD